MNRRYCPDLICAFSEVTALYVELNTCAAKKFLLMHADIMRYLVNGVDSAKQILHIVSSRTTDIS